MKTVVSFEDDNGTTFIVEFLFNPGGDKFTAKYCIGVVGGYPDLAWATADIGLVDIWDFRNLDNNLLNQIVTTFISGVAPVTQVLWWDKYDALAGYPVSGIPYYPDNNRFVAFKAFMAQPRIKDPCKGWSAEELQGPYTNACDITGIFVEGGGEENLRIRPRALMVMDASGGTSMTFVLNLDDTEGSYITTPSTLTVGTILPIRPIGVLAPTTGIFFALW
jgi:hypothetical protein